MKIWQKIALLVFSVILISLLLHWWMSYENMSIIIRNERNESVNVNLTITTMEDKEVFNASFSLESNESILLSNITTWAGNYYVDVVVNGSKNFSIKEKIKYGKYFERIEIIIDEKGVRILNERT